MEERDIYLFEQPAVLETVGGKGLNLIRLAQAGLPVPPGFVVSTAAYTAFVHHNRLDELLSSCFSALENGRPLAEVSEQIRSGFISGEFPETLSSQISAAYA